MIGRFCWWSLIAIVFAASPGCMHALGKFHTGLSGPEFFQRLTFLSGGVLMVAVSLSCGTMVARDSRLKTYSFTAALLALALLMLLVVTG